MADEKPKIPGRAGIRVAPDLALPPPEGANFFHFTVVGADIQMLVGAINLLQLHDAKNRGVVDALITPQITHRFTLSAFGFVQLKAQIDEIAAAVGASGVEFAPKT